MGERLNDQTKPIKQPNGETVAANTSLIDEVRDFSLRAGREVEVFAKGTGWGIAQGLEAAKKDKIGTATNLATAFGVGLALTACRRGPMPLRLLAAAATAGFGVNFYRDVGNHVGQLAEIASDTWKSGDHKEKNIALASHVLGKFTFDSAAMLVAGGTGALAGERIALARMGTSAGVSLGETRFFRVAEQDTAKLAEFRTGSSRDEALLTVQEVLGRGWFGKERVNAAQRLLVRHAEAQGAMPSAGFDMLATCNPEVLAPGLQGRDVFSGRPGPRYLSVDNSGSRIALSMENKYAFLAGDRAQTAEVIRLDEPKIMRGGLVQFDGMKAEVRGFREDGNEVVILFRQAEPPTKAETTTPADKLSVIDEERHWHADLSGNVYLVKNGTGTLIPSLRVVERSKLAPVTNEFSQAQIHDAGPAVRGHQEGLRKLLDSKFSTQQVLDHLAKAPLFEGRNALGPGLAGGTTIFNSTGGHENCTACVAALFRTLAEGKLWTDRDIYNIRTSNVERLGTPAPGRFRDVSDAERYLRDAMGDEKLPAPFEASAKMTFDSTGSKGHAIFQFRNSSGELVQYDPQSGMRLQMPMVGG